VLYERSDQPFRHVALIYRGADDMVARTLPFLRKAVREGAATLVATSAEKCERLRDALGADAAGVEFHDMARAGANPARIIPLWLDFAARNPDRPLRGVGEPIWAERSDGELVECVHHEGLLNLAFGEQRDFELICPYDEESLPAELLAEARRTHPVIEGPDGEIDSTSYVGPNGSPFDGPMPLPPATAGQFDYSFDELSRLRRMVTDRALAAGLSSERAMDLALAVHELATNSIRHGGGSGRLMWWEEDGAFVCEVKDEGVLTEALVGRVPPPAGSLGGRGLWLVNQLCDLVQIRSGKGPNRIRVRMARG
jgi:anti-sigma regulatory factor (Ser/Thr protein kinase)